MLLLDDPTRGIDVGAKAELYRLMDGLCRAGLGIIVTSSELPELLTVCDRILVLMRRPADRRVQPRRSDRTADHGSGDEFCLQLCLNNVERLQRH